jgi:beta-galactosidase
MLFGKGQEMKPGILLGAIAFCTFVFVGAGWGQAGYMVHEKAAATSYVTYNQRGFIINGKPTYLYVAEVHHPRIPRGLWKERLMKLKRAGYNTVSSYSFWSLHEPVKGEFHFEDNLDVDAWLSLIDSLGMYSIMRVGPYICAETDFGGFPCWLADEPSMQYRVSTGPFMTCVDNYWAKLFPLILKHQIHKGGSLISVQLENEYYHTDATYQQHLINTAVSLGLEVPYTWSKCINGNQPWTQLPGSGSTPFVNNNNGFPLFASEFWMGWFNENGEPTATEKYNAEYGTWQFISYGTGGISHYMANGGTNFGYTASDDNQNTSYDYHAPIGECGQFRSQYWTLKQAGLFSRTFESILATSTNGATATPITLSTSTNLTSWVHTTPSSGTIAIVYNSSTSPASTRLTWTKKNITVPTTAGAQWTLDGQKFYHFLSDVPVTSNVTIDYSATGIMTIKKIGTKNYLVLYGTAGTSGEIAFVYKAAPAPTPASPWNWAPASNRASLIFTYPPNDSVAEASVSEGSGQTINLLIMNTTQALNKTWIDDTFIASGPGFVDESNNLQFSSSDGRAFIFSGAQKQTIAKPVITAPTETALSGWAWLASPEPGTYDDSQWKSGPDGGRMDMAAFGWANGYGWYRYTLNAAQASTQTFAFYGTPVEDMSKVYVNGQYSVSQTQLQIKQGSNTIAIFVGDYSRCKEFGNYGAPRSVDYSGMQWGFTLNGASVPNSQVKFRGGYDGLVESPMMGTITTASWSSFLARTWNSSAAPSDNIPKFWRTNFNFSPPDNGYQSWVLNSTVTKAGRGVVWLNGHCIGRNLEINFPLFVPQCWLNNGANTMLVFTEDGSMPSNYRLTPAGEYRSFASLPTGVARPAINPEKSPLSQSVKEASFKVAGNTFIVPPGFAGATTLIAVYGLSGKLLDKFVTTKNAITLIKGHGTSQGVYIVRVSALSY